MGVVLAVLGGFGCARVGAGVGFGIWWAEQCRLGMALIGGGDSAGEGLMSIINPGADDWCLVVWCGYAPMIGVVVLGGVCLACMFRSGCWEFSGMCLGCMVFLFLGSGMILGFFLADSVCCNITSGWNDGTLFLRMRTRHTVACKANHSIKYGTHARHAESMSER